MGQARGHALDEQHAALAGKLMGEYHGLVAVLPVLINQREGKSLLAVVNVLIEEFPYHRSNAWGVCTGCRLPVQWNDCPIVRAVAAAVADPGNIIRSNDG